MFTYSQGYLGVRWGQEEDDSSLLCSSSCWRLLSHSFHWWRVGVPQTRIAWLWDIPRSPALERSPSSGALSKLCSPTCSCLQAGGAQAHGRAISQPLDVLLGRENRHTSFLLLSALIELTLVSALLSFLQCEESSCVWVSSPAELK